MLFPALAMAEASLAHGAGGSSMHVSTRVNIRVIIAPSLALGLGLGAGHDASDQQHPRGGAVHGWVGKLPAVVHQSNAGRAVASLSLPASPGVAGAAAVYTVAIP